MTVEDLNNLAGMAITAYFAGVACGAVVALIARATR